MTKLNTGMANIGSKVREMLLHEAWLISEIARLEVATMKK